MAIAELSASPSVYFAGAVAIAGVLAICNFSRNRQLARAERRVDDIIDRMSEGYYRATLDGTVVRANPALVEVTGLSSEEELLERTRTMTGGWYVMAGRREQFREQLLREGEVKDFVSEITRFGNDERTWIVENAQLVNDGESGEPLFYEGTAREIRLEMRGDALEERLRKLAANLPGGLFQLRLSANGEFSVPYLSESFFNLMNRGKPRSIENPNDYLKYIHPEDVAGYTAAVAESAAKLIPINHRFRYRSVTNGYVWLHITATPEREKDGATLWHGHVSDVTIERERERQIEHLAYFDTVTGLPKRTILHDRLRAVISACNRRKEMAALLFIDLDNFKQLNDTHGHQAGDKVLEQISGRMVAALRTSDLVCRYGGDEFVVVVDNLGEAADGAVSACQIVSEKLIATLREPISIEGHEVRVSASIGACLIGQGHPEADDIVAAADAAMYQAKRDGGGRHVMHKLDIKTLTAKENGFRRRAG